MGFMQRKGEYYNMEKELLAFFNNVHFLQVLFDGVIIVSKDKKILFFNESAEKILEEHFSIGSPCSAFFSICQSCPMNIVEENKSGVQIYDIRTKNEKHVCLSITPLFVGDEFIGVIEVFRDVSKVIFYMEEVKKQKEFIEVTLNSIIEAVLIVDDRGNVIDYNAIAKKVLCREYEELKGKNLKDIVKLSLEELPNLGERTDIYIETPCGIHKASILLSPLKIGKGFVISFYIVPESMSNLLEKGDIKIITRNPIFRNILNQINVISDYDTNILLEGETGTGKSFLAKYIHYMSPRRNGPFVKVNCTAIPDTLLEAELFGHVRGAFTGAVRDKPGKVELADGGTLFLDEIGDMPLHLQAKILHFVQEKEFERLGDTKTRKANVRIIASTNRNLKELMRRGQFREDLYYRLGVVKLHIPPLRERKEDIPLLVNHFIEKYSKMYSRRIKGISSEAMKLLLSYNFPGNVRELENLIERAVITCRGSVINPEDIHIEMDSMPFVKEEEIERIRQVLEQTGGNRSLAAKILGMHRTTLWRKMKELGL